MSYQVNQVLANVQSAADSRARKRLQTSQLNALRHSDIQRSDPISPAEIGHTRLAAFVRTNAVAPRSRPFSLGHSAGASTFGESRHRDRHPNTAGVLCEVFTHEFSRSTRSSKSDRGQYATVLCSACLAAKGAAPQCSAGSESSDRQALPCWG